MSYGCWLQQSLSEAMTVVEKIRQLLALAASTTFAGERDSAVAKARLLFNKH